jgi:hypothetical protein
MSTARPLLHRQVAVHTETSTSDKAKYPSPLTDRDTLMISSTNRSSIRSGHTEQRRFIKIGQWEGVQWEQLQLQLLELYGDDILSHWEMCYWSRQFLLGREYAEEARMTVRFQDSASNSECTRGNTICLCSMNCRGHAHSCSDRVFAF